MATSNIALAFKQDTRGLSATDAAARKTSGNVGALSVNIKKLGIAMAGLVSIRALSGIARDVVTTGMAFQDLRVQLHTVTGSAAGAESSFEWIKGFAASTPFQVDKITESFVGLKARGFEPMARVMTNLGDLAAAFGKDVTTSMQAVTQAAFGEGEMLKQFGIIMKQQGDQVSLTYKGTTKVVQKNSRDIFEALVEMAGQSGGAMERLSQTLSGRLSTMKDAFANLSDRIVGSNGALDSLSDFALEVTKLVESAAVQNLAEQVGLLAKSLLDLGKSDAARAGVERFFGEFAGFLEDLRTFNSLKPDAERLASILDFVFEQADGSAVSAAESLRKWARAIEIVANRYEENSIEGTVNAEVMDRIAAAGAAFVPVLDGVGDAALTAKEKASKLKDVLKELKDDLLAKTINVAPIVFEPGDINLIGGLEGELKELKRKIAESATSGLVWAAEDHDWIDEFKKNVSWSFTTAIQQAFASGDVRGAIRGLSSNLGASLGNALAQQLGAKAGGPLAALGAGIGGLVIGAVANSVFGEKAQRAWGGVIDDFTQAVGIFRQAALALQDAQINILRMTGGLFDLVGRINTAQFGDEFHASLGGQGTRGDEGLIKTLGTSGISGILGRGQTAAAAIDDLIRQVVLSIENGTAEAFVDLAGFSDFFVTAIKNSAAASLSDLQQAIRSATDIFKAGLGPAHAAIFQAFNDLGAMAAEAARLGLAGSQEFANAIKNGIQGAISGLAGADLYPAFADAEAVMETFTAGLEKLGIVGKEAKQYLSDAATALEIYNSRLKSDVLQQIVGVFSNIPKLAEKAAAIQAQVDQARMVIEIAISKIRLRELFESGLIQKGLFAELRKGLRQAGRWAKDLDHFIAKVPAAVASPNVTVVVPDAGTGVGGGGGTGGGVDSASRETRNWQAFKAWLAARGLDWREIPAADLAAFKDEWRRDPSGGFERAPAGGGTGGGGGIVQTFRDIWTALIDGLREFQKSLNLSSFAPGTPRELAGLALGNVKDLFAKAMGGDTDALKAFQAAAQQALTLGSAAFGTSTGYFQETFFQAIQTMIDQLKAVDPADVDPAKNPTVGAVKDQTTALVGSLDSVGARIFAMQKSTESRLDKLVLAFERSGGMVPAT